ncbi:hypothetical protein HYDPIDRAFT_29080 [Hydnomerulius pinastri MD-312]|uniref:CCHC-type domain-containing protein n=1 Tax=Hydnomerulius pinastri MD-312 TaxID=994086 RepID=A0A0C9W8F2_9AGAM|nr:hypothetical protein HYDPIDRAFT_29080 [Hydnomerulius pinastri MD-312]
MSSMEAVEGSAGPSRPPSTRDVLNSLQEQIALMQQTINEQAAQLEDRTPVTNIEKKFNKKVEVIADPGQYTGEKARFTEWWTKMRIWLQANADALSNNFKLCTVNERDWACSQIQSCKQGNLQVDEYISKWLFLYRQSKISEEHAVYLLEINTNPHIIKQVFTLSGQADIVNAYLERIQTIGRAQESFLMFQPSTKTQGHAWGNNASGSKTYGGQGKPMDIGATTKIRGAGSSECYKCSKGGHFACDCKAPNCRCGSNRHTSERHPAGQGKGKGHEVRSTSMTNDAPQSQADFKQMDFEEAKAFFYNMQVAEMKSQGKGFGP